MCAEGGGGGGGGKREGCIHQRGDCNHGWSSDLSGIGVPLYGCGSSRLIVSGPYTK